MKKFILIILSLGIILIFSACNTLNFKFESEIILVLNVSNLSAKEYQSIDAKGREIQAKDDFKKIELNLMVNNSKEISNRNIYIPSIKDIIESYDKNCYWFGNSSKKDNPKEKLAEYTDKAVIYSKGLDNESIKNIFNSYNVKVSYINKNDTSNEQVINLGDVIQFI